ncbi:hypothetical protein D3C77_628600 [compost metagenome]
MLELTLRNEHQFILNAEPLSLIHRFVQSTGHADDEWMGLIPVKTVEPEIKTAEPDRIQG